MIVYSPLAWRSLRGEAAKQGRHGLQVLYIEQLAARLAGGFLRPIDSDALKAAIAKAITIDLGELNRIKDLPGFPRAAAAALSKAWTAGPDVTAVVGAEGRAAQSRLEAIKRLEHEVLRHLPPSMRRPADLIAAALTRLHHAKVLFGRVSVVGHTEMSPLWRTLLARLADVTEVFWIAGPRFVPSWVADLGIQISKTPPEDPEIRCESCASPRHEALEALRWARSLIVSGKARPEDMAIAAAWPEEWDDHFLALSQMSGLDLCFLHGRRVLTTPDGQLAASLAELLLRGFSQARMSRFISLLRTQNPDYKTVPPDWWRVLRRDAPLLDASRWREVLTTIPGNGNEKVVAVIPILRELVDTLDKGLKQAREVGERLLLKQSLAIWRRSLMDGPPEALDVTLASFGNPTLCRRKRRSSGRRRPGLPPNHDPSYGLSALPHALGRAARQKIHCYPTTSLPRASWTLCPYTRPTAEISTASLKLRRAKWFARMLDATVRAGSTVIRRYTRNVCPRSTVVDRASRIMQPVGPTDGSRVPPNSRHCR
jgi:hypothetical protein